MVNGGGAPQFILPAGTVLTVWKGARRPVLPSQERAVIVEASSLIV